MISCNKDFSRNKFYCNHASFDKQHKLKSIEIRFVDSIAKMAKKNGKFRLFRATTIIAYLHKSRHLRRNNQSKMEYKFKLAAKESWPTRAKEQNVTPKR